MSGYGPAMGRKGVRGAQAEVDRDRRHALRSPASTVVARIVRRHGSLRSPPLTGPSGHLSPAGRGKAETPQLCLSSLPYPTPYPLPSSPYPFPPRPRDLRQRLAGIAAVVSSPLWGEVASVASR